MVEIFLSKTLYLCFLNQVPSNKIPNEMLKSGGLNHLPYLLSISVSMAVIKDFSKNMFIWIDNGKYITAINKKFIHFFFIWITQMISD